MPVHRDKDGNIVEEPTRFEPSATPADEKPTTSDKPPEQKPSPAADTVVIGRSAPTGGADDMTRLVGAPGKSGQKTSGGRAMSEPLGSPVTGWLVVIKGPGRGNSLPLGYGRNSIGRAPSERVALDFGDDEISRTHHAAVTYDPRGRKFYISHGDSNNLTYVGNKPVLSAEMLKPLSDIGVGKTVLRFVPFCGDDFDWQSEE